jgi:hypothetical protein
MLWLMGWLLIMLGSYKSTQEPTLKQTIVFEKVIKEDNQEELEEIIIV